MTRIPFLIVLLAVFAVSTVVAQEDGACSAAVQEVCDAKELLNIVEGGEVPSVFPSNAVIQVAFVNQTPIGYAVIENRRLGEITCCAVREDATHRGQVRNASTLQFVLSADNPLVAMNNAFSSGDLVLEAESFAHRTRLVVGRVLLHMAAWLS